MPLLTSEGPVSPPLAGTKGNPAHDPTRKGKEGKGSIGDKALMDGIIIVVLAWALLLFLGYSLRHHNV